MNRNPFNSIKTGLLFFFLLALFHSPVNAQTQIGRSVERPVKAAVVNFQQMADVEALLPRPPINRKSFIPNDNAEHVEPVMPAKLDTNSTVTVNRITVVSPSPSLNYEGVPDGPQTGSGFWNIPPDTYGAVGLDKVFVQVNNNYRILNKVTGAQLSVVSIETFWNSLGVDGDNVFDPRVVYDPYNNRWIVAAVSNGNDAASRVLLGISQTHDPQGNYNLYSFDPDPGTANWADYPMLGFNKNWIAIGINMFPIAAGSPPNRFYVIDYPALRSGTVTSTVFTGTQFCTHPAETYSATENTLYAPNHFSSAGASYQLNTITGTPSVPVFTVGGLNSRTTGGGWLQQSGNIGPQTCVNGAAPIFTCPGTLAGVDVGDAYIRGNVVFRNNAIWYAQAVGLPLAGLTHTGVQWTKLNTSGTFADGGRVEVPTATNSNGEHWYTYPTLSVNSNSDVLMGFTKTESDGYPGAAYAFRYGTDAAGTMQDPVVYKDGVDYYEKDFGGSRNRWGDYSHTMVDPLNDASFWTIQEYAQSRATPNLDGYSKWGTWWAKVDPNPCLSNAASGNWNVAGTWGCGSVPTASNHVSIISGQNVTMNVDPSAASITVLSGGTLTINSTRTLSCKLIVYGTLNITGGKLQLGNNDVFLAEGATVTGASSSSYFVTNGTGVVTKIIAAGSSFEFPVSPNASSYNALTINNTTGPIEVYSVRVSTGITPSSSNNAVCVQRTWNINEMTTGGNTANLTFKWAAAEHGGSFNVSGTPYTFRHNGSTYVMVGSMTTPVLASGIYSSTTSAPVSSFSPWIVSSSAALPIIMEYFTGTKLSNGTHQLDWKATCTGPNAVFDLERSSDGRIFSPIKNIAADYNRCLQPFAHTDLSPLTGKNYYRVRMKDEYGKITYSNIVLLLNSKSGFEIVNLQPNPVSNIARLNYSSAQREELNIVITDSKGSLVFRQTIQAVSGVNQEELNVASLPAGTYTLSLVSESGGQRNIRFVKQ
ncbi:MAG TPA: T9SS type A sorting domain-containing protein [Chitinophagaceae bacterium]|nr:T9SS type A sorting domain-containing protein [Chitinophagaceae bacterium]